MKTQAESWVHGYLTLSGDDAFNHWHVLDSIPYHPDQSRYRAVGVEVWVFPDGSCVSQREAQVYHAHASLQDAVPLAEIPATTMASEWVRKRDTFRSNDRMLAALDAQESGTPERFYCFRHNHACTRFSDGSCVTYVTTYPPDYLSDVQVDMVAHASVEDAALHACANPVERTPLPPMPELTLEEKCQLKARLLKRLTEREGTA